MPPVKSKLTSLCWHCVGFDILSGFGRLDSFESVYNEDNWLQGTCLACVLRVLYQKIQR
ncbi:hypothetical protein RO3G_11959 [Rhizopus delemar RA 99-880]|uniref:Uncharacterized protein n=1 Tax=Rhizopus delemar (strain RA 99-880 / ATCC MYA-4621 / FGSC 9543 / NRRL 43880) TaxID=246409 RepID=I1CFL8_RHIO9|nr:hypothetical protein RO3G_11959 [Rhizopus delemar RA 99-880]|eukprot:EIE87248.1 hypothetical protein RO3G_11959 [Rhizopus delemar RA 99-880]